MVFSHVVQQEQTTAGSVCRDRQHQLTTECSGSATKTDEIETEEDKIPQNNDVAVVDNTSAQKSSRIIRPTETFSRPLADNPLKSKTSSPTQSECLAFLNWISSQDGCIALAGRKNATTCTCLTFLRTDQTLKERMVHCMLEYHGRSRESRIDFAVNWVRSATMRMHNAPKRQYGKLPITAGADDAASSSLLDHPICSNAFRTFFSLGAKSWETIRNAAAVSDDATTSPENKGAKRKRRGKPPDHPLRKKPAVCEEECRTALKNWIDQPVCLEATKKLPTTCTCLHFLRSDSETFSEISAFMVQYGALDTTGKWMVLNRLHKTAIIDGKRRKMFVCLERSFIAAHQDDADAPLPRVTNRICQWALMTILNVAYARMRQAQHHQDQNSIQGNSNNMVGKHPRVPGSIRNRDWAPGGKDALRGFLDRVCSEARPGIDEDGNKILVVPLQHTKRSLWRKYAFEHGWIITVEQKKGQQAQPRDGVQQKKFCAHRTFLSFLKNHYAHLRFQSTRGGDHQRMLIKQNERPNEKVVTNLTEMQNHLIHMTTQLDKSDSVDRSSWEMFRNLHERIGSMLTRIDFEWEEAPSPNNDNVVGQRAEEEYKEEHSSNDENGNKEFPNDNTMNDNLTAMAESATPWL